MSEDRRLAAIMFTDIVGYTALMGSDEDTAFKTLRKNRTIQRPIIKKYRGEWLKEMGDGILASFHTASDAVRCAGDIQHAAKKEGIALRIGIHEGEVVFEGGDVLGNGVNVASRLEEMAEEGCINISASVYRDIKNKADIQAKLIGEKKFKNVDEPIKVYEVLCANEVEKPEEDNFHKAKNRTLYYIIAGILVIISVILIWQFLPSGRKNIQTLGNITNKSIAVIPFWDDSPNSDNAYFCSGMEEEIRIHLLKIADLKIESRQSVEKYRENPDIDARTIGKELEVAFIVEGSVQKLEEDIRVRVQLIDAKTGDHIWAETYDGEYNTKLFEFQSNTARKIASSLNAVITPEEIQEMEQVPTADIRAYDLIIRARNAVGKYWDTRDTKPLKLAHKLIDKALEIDPQYEDALSIKSGVYIAEQNYDSAYIFAERVLEIDPESATGYEALGEYYRFKGIGGAAIENYELALKYYIERSFLSKSRIKFFLGDLYCNINNDYRKGMKYMQEGINKADSFDYVHRGYLGRIFLSLGDYEKAKKYFNEMLNSGSEFGLCWGIAEYSRWYIIHGNYNEAVNFLDSICSITLCESQCNQQLFWNYTFDGQFEQADIYYNQYLTSGGTPWVWDSILLAYTYKELGKEQEATILLNDCIISLEGDLSQREYWFNYVSLSIVYAILDDKEESLRYLSDATDLGLKVGWHDFLPICPIYKNYWDDPEFKSIVKRSQDERADRRAEVEKMIEKGEIDL